ncbi:biopolymer transporter ExbD [Terriglobus albidus]|uniref:biopolymer transporter ExbD n=1 Tax=Terriglobus albidus TaxID=1592106 RepID=UPI0021E067E5|nr:biopolymer transporter ExbD [Terriglobus albidus]
MAFTATTRGIASEINVTPLIDVLLVLLIIFMVIAPVSSQGIGAALPQPGAHTASEPVSAPLVVQLSYGESGVPAYALNRQEMNLDEMGNRLAMAMNLRQDRTVFLQADGRFDLQEVVGAVNTIRRAGASEIALLTRKDCNQMNC